MKRSGLLDILRFPKSIRSTREMYVLGSVLLHPDKQVLTVGDRAVSLQRKPFQVLVFLVENRHRMVTRKELLDQFWDGKEVYDQSLSKAVGTIRKALGEPSASDYIETRWGLGYRYIGPFLQGPSGSSIDPAEPPAVASTVAAPELAHSICSGYGKGTKLEALAHCRCCRDAFHRCPGRLDADETPPPGGC